MTEEQVFLAALDLADPAAITKYLDKVCGRNTEFRAQVEALLAAHRRSGEFLDRPAGEQLAAGRKRSEDQTQEFDSESDGDVMSAKKDDHSSHSNDDDEDLYFLSKPTRPDSLGRIGHYEVLEILGKGGFGIVFRAFDDVLQRVVAVKVMAPALAATSPARKRFLREARSSAQVRHESVVQVYAVEEQPLPYLVMEFIPGETLQQRLDRIGPLEVPMILRIGRQIAEGLAAAHETGLIHRDIKPSNMLIEGGSQERVKITDFGLARAADDASLTRSGVVAGTPMYMSPEQAKGESFDHRADLFSLGSVMYVMASGRPPFRASTTFAVLKRVAEEEPRPIREVIPEVPEWLCSIIAKLHAKDPAARFQTAQEVADLLADCERKLKAQVSVKNVVAAPRAKPAARKGLTAATAGTGRKKWVAAVVAAAVLLPVIALAVTELAGITHLFHDPQPATKIGSGPTPTTPVDPKEKPPIQGVKQETPAPDAGNGSFLKPVEMKSEGGATLKLQDDGSILVSGEHPAKDSYTLTFGNLPAKIQALRLEVLPHSSLPNKGPGRHASGEFVLTKVKAQLEFPKKPGEPRILKLAKAWADNRRGDDSDVSFAIDEDDNTGWVTEVGKAHFAVFELAEPVTVSADAVLRVILEFKHEGAQLQLGCFRLSAAADANAFKDPDRKAAEYVLSIGGTVCVDGNDSGIRAKAELPQGPFRLTLVDLFQNKQVTDTGLAVFDNCTNVTSLSLYHCTQVTDAGLAHFKDCKGLTSLALEGVSLTDAGLANFKDYKNLEYLELGGQPQVTDAGLAHLKDCKKLTTLHLYQCGQVTDVGLAHLKGCKQLTLLDLRFTQVTDAGLAYFKDCKDLKALWLADTAIKDAGLVHFKDCKNLTDLFLDGTSITDEGLAFVKDCKDLQWLRLNGTKVSDASLGHLKNCKNLEMLQLQNTKVSDTGLGHVKDCKNLKSFDVRKTKVSAAGIDTLKKALPGCKIDWDSGVIDPNGSLDSDRKAAEYVLSIGGIVKVNEQNNELKNAKELPPGPFLLTGVNLDHNKQVNDAGMANFKDCKNLMSIHLHHTEVGDAGLAHLKDCKNLTHLWLAGIQITDAGMAHFKDCKNLSSLNLAHTQQVKGAGLAHLKDCKNLTQLWLNETQVTEAGMAHLKNFKNLAFFTLHFNMQVNDTWLPHLKECKNLTELHLGKTNVSTAGIDELKKVLPKCKIDWEGGVVELGGAFTDADVKRIAALTAAEQVEEVRKELKKRNPKFDGMLTPTIQDGAVTALKFSTEQVTDISPVRALIKLQDLNIPGNQGSLVDLSPLKGMTFTVLRINDNKVTDLSPLKGMPLQVLALYGNSVADLSPLKDMPLKELEIGGTKVQNLTALAGMKLEKLIFESTTISDLAPLKGMKLIGLDAYNTLVADLSPLKGMPLESLNIRYTKVADVTPLKGMPLVSLNMGETPVTDLSPLKDLPLKSLNCDFQAVPRDAKILQAIKSLETINGKKAVELLKDFNNK